MTTAIYVDSTGTWHGAFTDDAGDDVDPSAITLVIKDSAGTTKATKTCTACGGTPGDFTRDREGHYHYHHDTASTDAVGMWHFECTATIASLDEVSVAEFYVRGLNGTTYFNVTATRVKRKYKDTDFDDAEIEAEAQEQEDDVMGQLSLTSAPSDTFKKSRLRKAIILMTASELEGNEPHSRADGSVRMDKFSRVLWMKEANEIIASYRTRYVTATSYQTDSIASRWDE